MDRDLTRAAMHLKTSLLLLFFAFSFLGCSVVLDTTECESDTECAALVGPGSTCINNTCTEAADTSSDSMPDIDEDGDIADSETDGDGPQVIEVSDNITQSTSWVAPNTYLLTRTIFVTNNAQLTIEPGVTVLGQGSEFDPDDPSTRVGGALIVTRGSKLFAEGTRDNPIVFTSAQPEGERSRGDWGGVAILGNARNNNTDGLGTLEGVVIPEGGDDEWATYGGEDDQYQCGILRFVRIEFAGYELAPGDELNGLTLGSCGSRTIIDHVQVHMADDDGIEIFGGTVGPRNIVITRADDDSLDWDRGWRGSAQFVSIWQDNEGDKGFESDNWSDDNEAVPLSNPIIYNATIVGEGAGGMNLKQGTGGRIFNTIVFGQATGVQVSGEVSVDRMMSGALTFENSIVFGNDTAFKTSGLTDCQLWLDWDTCTTDCMGQTCVDMCETQIQADYSDEFAELTPMEVEEFFANLSAPYPNCQEIVDFDIDMYLRDESRGNIFENPGLRDITNPATLYPTMAISVAAGPGMTPPEVDPFDNEFDITATYIGAFEPGREDTWIQGWTAFPEN